MSTGTANGFDYVDVTVTYNFQLVSSYLGFSSRTLSRTVRMRSTPATPG